MLTFEIVQQVIVGLNTALRLRLKMPRICTLHGLPSSRYEMSSISYLYRKHARALTFQNFSQAKEAERKRIEAAAHTKPTRIKFED